MSKQLAAPVSAANSDRAGNKSTPVGNTRRAKEKRAPSPNAVNRAAKAILRETRSMIAHRVEGSTNFPTYSETAEAERLKG
ncbi:hypothetical protein [Chromobacterium subtsugae]|uniref:hypothetical protein n=1 Tax=Chromobacterium subtsugae TaxID=251747 RepID=UPI0012D484DB|nr:hypothetical protein [Chromobacterium subtsugae]